MYPFLLCVPGPRAIVHTALPATTRVNRAKPSVTLLVTHVLFLLWQKRPPLQIILHLCIFLVSRLVRAGLFLNWNELFSSGLTNIATCRHWMYKSKHSDLYLWICENHLHQLRKYNYVLIIKLLWLHGHNKRQHFQSVNHCEIKSQIDLVFAVL